MDQSLRSLLLLTKRTLASRRRKHCHYILHRACVLFLKVRDRCLALMFGILRVHTYIWFNLTHNCIRVSLYYAANGNIWQLIWTYYVHETVDIHVIERRVSILTKLITYYITLFFKFQATYLVWCRDSEWSYTYEYAYFTEYE